MNELEKQLANAVEKAMQLAETTGQFVIDQAPDLIQQFYMWHITSSVFFIVLGATVMAGWYFLGHKKLYDSEDEEEFLNRDSAVPLTVGWVVFTFGGLSMIIVNVYNLLFILVAPKIYIIEHFIK